MPKMTFTRKHVYNSRPYKVGDEVEVEDRFVAILRHLNVAELSKGTTAPKRGRPPKAVPVVEQAKAVESPPPAPVQVTMPQRRIFEEVMDEKTSPSDEPQHRDLQNYRTRDLTAESEYRYERKSVLDGDDEEVK